MLRFSASIVLSLVVTFCLFFVMQRIIFQDRVAKQASEKYEYVDFIRLKPKIEKIEKKQTKKKIEEKQKQLPKRVVLTSSRQKVQTKMPKINMQPIDMPRNFKDNVSLNDIAIEQEESTKAPVSTGYSTDIVPLFTVPPSYPRMAKRRNIQGYVILNFTIDEKGNVKDIAVKEAKPKGFFEKAAKKAIARWRFKPKYDGERAIEQLAQQKLEFTLR